MANRQFHLPHIEVDLRKKDSLLYRLLSRLIRRGFKKSGNNGEIKVHNPILNPQIFIGPADPYDDDQLKDLSRWKAGPIYLQWDDNEKVWTGGIGVHHHLDNSLREGGIAFAYFFR